MYLAKPSDPSLNPSMAISATVVPGAATQFENLLKNDTTIRCSIKELNNQKRITIEFTIPATYKKIEYYINNKTGYLEKMINVERSDQLYDASVQHLVDAEQSYAIVEAVYANYRPGNVDDNLFDVNRYFKKEGDDYITVAPYDTYKIFLGTPNL